MYYNARRLFIASCLALITSAFSFQMRQNIGDDLGTAFSLTKESVGALMGGQFLGMALAMLVFAPVCDLIGMGKVLGLAWICHALGIAGTLFADELAGQNFALGIAKTLGGLSQLMTDKLHFSLLPDMGRDQTAFWVLWLAAFMVGSANGLVEIAINPLAATLYSDEKTHKLNVLHAWWPGGLIVAGLIALFLVNPVYGKPAPFFEYTIDPRQLGLEGLITAWPSWKLKYSLIAVPLVLYGFTAIGQRFPETERVQANVSFAEMVLQIIRPLFIIWAFCMLLTASTELATNAWMESIVTRTANVSGTLVFIYITFLMFILRFFAGPIAHQISPIGIMFFGSIFTAAGLYWLSIADTRAMAFAAATVFALGIVYFWPTMLGVTAERFPKGGALLLGLMGCVGNLAISQTTPMLGAIYDSYTVYSLPDNLRDKQVAVPSQEGQPPNNEPLVISTTISKWIPQRVAQRIYPAGGEKINPAARTALVHQPAKADLLTAVEQAEVEGARWAFRWTTVLPSVLIVIFGLVALYDYFRGGYCAEQISGF